MERGDVLSILIYPIHVLPLPISYSFNSEFIDYFSIKLKPGLGETFKYSI